MAKLAFIFVSGLVLIALLAALFMLFDVPEPLPDQKLREAVNATSRPKLTYVEGEVKSATKGALILGGESSKDVTYPPVLILKVNVNGQNEMYWAFWEDVTLGVNQNQEGLRASIFNPGENKLAASIVLWFESEEKKGDWMLSPMYPPEENPPPPSLTESR